MHARQARHDMSSVLNIFHLPLRSTHHPVLCPRRSDLYKLHRWATFPSSFPLHLVNGKLWQEIRIKRKCEKGLFIPSAPFPEGTIYNWMSQLLPANPLYIACPVSRLCWLLSLFLQPNVGTPLGNYRVPGSLPTLCSYFCTCTLYESNYFHTFELLTLSVSSLSC